MLSPEAASSDTTSVSHRVHHGQRWKWQLLKSPEIDQSALALYYIATEGGGQRNAAVDGGEPGQSSIVQGQGR
jgi:hypothetical protein